MILAAQTAVGYENIINIEMECLIPANLSDMLII